MYFIENRTWRVSAGDLVLIDRNTLHKTMDTGIGRHERVLIEFSGDFLGSLKEELSALMAELFRSQGRILRLRSQERMQIEASLEKMLDEHQTERPDHRLLLSLLLSELLIFIRRLKTPERTHSEAEVCDHPKIAAVLRHIHDHFSDHNLRLDDVSAQFSMSKFYFCRAFKQSTGYTFIEYLCQLRIREAQRLLKDTRMKVIEIAQHTGFDDASHFSRTFKRMTGLSPREYRANGVGSRS